MAVVRHIREKAERVDERIRFVFQQISRGDFEVVLEHSGLLAKCISTDDELFDERHKIFGRGKLRMRAIQRHSPLGFFERPYFV